MADIVPSGNEIFLSKMSLFPSILNILELEVVPPNEVGW